MNIQSFITILLTILMSMTGAKAFAHDIAVANSDGVTIYYNWANSEKTELSVSYGRITSLIRKHYSGNVVIPKSVVYEGNIYSVTSIGSDAFGDCNSLTSITIPSSITSIGESAFSGCSGLESIKVENGNTIFDSRSDCNAIIRTSDNMLILGCKNSIIPYGVTSIGQSAFYKCSGLTSVTIPSSVTSIGRCAFGGCSGLTSVSIPNSVTAIGNNAFWGCCSLISIMVDSGNPKYDSRNNCNALIETTTNTIILGCKNTNIPNSVQSIGNSAFEGCSGLTSIAIPSSVTSIGVSAFKDCSGLASITIPNTVIKIGNYAFDGCSSLKSLVLPEHITKRNIHVAKAGTLYELLPQDESYIVEELTLTGELNGTDFFLIRDMAGTNYMGYPTRTDGKLSILNLENARIVAWGAPYIIAHDDGPDDTDEPDIEYEITKNDVIPEMLFCGCDKLTKIILPKNLISIEGSAFGGINLTSITIPQSVTSIGQYAFADCSSLNYIKVESGNEFYDSRNDCNAIIEKSSNTLICGCKNTIIPNSVTSVGKGAFSGCEGLTAIIIPSGVTTIGSYAFNGCKGLTSITIPSSLTSIGDNAFFFCNGLTDFYCKAENVPETGSDVFRFINQENITLHVPEGSIDAYSAVEPWKNFNIVALGPQCATPEISFVNGKIKLSSKTEGATYHYTITNEDIKSGNGDDVQLGMTYHVSAYATKDGFETSEVTTRDIVITGNGEAVVKGDVDGNGKVDAADVVTVTNIIMGK